MRKLILILVSVMATPALASSSRGGGAVSELSGDTSLGLYGGIVNASQDDINTLQSRANLNQGGISTGQLTQAYEIGAFMQFRFGGTMYALHFRPSYFYERQDGAGTTGQYTYAVTGYTVMPMLRLYPMENGFMKFYMQFGLGYGSAAAQISEGAGNSVKANASGFGTQVGLGAEFCLTASQCISFESDYRYMGFDRAVVSSSSGSFNTSKGSLSQYGYGQELEIDGHDLAMRLGGLMWMAGYAYYF